MNQLESLQLELLKWQHFVREQKTQHIIIFEGVDAAGKSGAIKRFMEHMNPRYARVVALDKPTEQEKAQWYWQRYIQQFPKAGEICFFDRSWYNRAGVEPVMGFCTQAQADHLLSECNQLEPVFQRAGIKIIKFFFSVSKEEQAKRFDARQTNPLKAGKMSAIDLAGQSKWDEYELAHGRMLTRTHDWVFVESDDKTKARVAAMQYVLLNNDYLGKDLEAIGQIDPTILEVSHGKEINNRQTRTARKEERQDRPSAV
jgi:polyphosphate kinase 2